MTVDFDFRVKLLAPCEMIGSVPDYHDWVFINEYEQRDAIGRRARSQFTGWSWQVFVCNNPDCPGRAVVRRDMIEELVSLRFPPPPGSFS